MIDRVNYEARLAARSIPAAVIATRPSTPSTGRRTTGGWSRGRNRDLTHNCWLIATADPSKKRKDVTHLVSFDAAIDFPCVLLSHESLNADRLTKKIIVLTSLEIGVRGNGGLDATHVAQMSRKYDWVLRHRVAEGYKSFAETPEHFASDLSMRLKKGGVLALVPIEERLDAVLEARTGTDPLVINRAFALELGVTTAALANSSEFKLALLDAEPSARVDISALEEEEDSRAAGGEGSTSKPDDCARGISSDLKVRRNLQGYLDILEFVFKLSERDLDHDRMERDPFEAMSMDAIITRDQKEGGRTNTLLPGDMMRALTAAARFIATYSDYILATFRDARRGDMIEAASSRELMPDGGVCILPIWNSGSRKRASLPPKTILLDEAIRHLFAASAILIAGFAARRDIGVRSAHLGCLTEDDDGVMTMKIYIGKTDKDRVDIPVPAILKAVVETLEKLSADTREAKRTEWLFEVAFDPRKPELLVSSRFHQIIDAFLEFAGDPPPEGQERWSLSIHMLRRGYGIWYYYGLIGGSPDALSLMYRHNDPNMTRIYFTMILPGEINQLKNELEIRLRSSVSNRTEEDQEWIDRAYNHLSYLKAHQKAFDGPRCEIFVEKLIGLWRGTESVIGAGGKALYNDVQAIAERAMGSIRIGSRVNDPGALEAPLLQRFIAYAKSHFLEPVLGSSMWCAADPHNAEHLADAECLKLKSRGKAPWRKDGVPEVLMPDYDFACNRVCVGCRFGVAFQDGQLALHQEVKQRRHASNHAATASLEEEGCRLLAELEAEIATAGPAQRGGAL
ncbi:tyrosine-type recombinase/integrase [Sinorhizobium medicae]|nr:tyrosine-type recombinase/integrase [Sinorhizobium medicae]